MTYPPQRCWITATDTDAGKTLVTCALLHYLTQQNQPNIGLKPIASGAHLHQGQLRNQDAEQLMRYSSETLPYSQVNPWCFEPAIAPHIASAQVQQPLASDAIQTHLNHIADAWPKHHLLVEGVGGVCVPLNATETTLDLMQALNWPVILVVGVKLGALNHALLTWQALQAKQIPIIGWIGKQMAPTPALLENLTTLKQRLPHPCLGFIPWFEAPPTPQDCIQYLQLSNPNLWRTKNQPLPS